MFDSSRYECLILVLSRIYTKHVNQKNNIIICFHHIKMYLHVFYGKNPTDFSRFHSNVSKKFNLSQKSAINSVQ